MTLDYTLNDYKKRDGSQAIRLRLIIDRVPQYIATGITIQKKQWNFKKSIICKHPLEDQLNGKLSNFLLEFQSFANQYSDLGSKKIVSLWRDYKKNGLKGKEITFYEFFQRSNNRIRNKGKISTANTRDGHLKKIKGFNENIHYSELTPDFLLRFERYMFDKGNKQNTVASNMSTLKIVVKEALKDGLIDKNPFDTYTIKRVNSNKEILSYSEILKIENLKIERHFIGIIRARDMFLFAFYNAGMRFGDVCRLKWSNIEDSNIVYVMNKSKNLNGSKRNIPLTPKVISILDKYKGMDKTYVFPILKGVDPKDEETIVQKIKVANNAVNRSWRIMCKNHGIKETTFHVSKHSFADYAVQNKIDLLVISKLLGHSRLATTQTYLKDFYQDKQTEALKSMFK
ncbi:site-specific integrase [Aquimarina intermedia]|nr:site-specific integrase [Aquimarina intermedia]